MSKFTLNKIRFHIYDQNKHFWAVYENNENAIYTEKEKIWQVTVFLNLDCPETCSSFIVINKEAGNVYDYEAAIITETTYFNIYRSLFRRILTACEFIEIE